MATTPESKPTETCTFCDKTGFDTMGLNVHMLFGLCEKTRDAAMFLQMQCESSERPE